MVQVGTKGKVVGRGGGDIMQERACFALHHAIPTAHLGAGIGEGGSPHNGSVSYPMRPVQ